jgi:hypothetical protein
MPQRFIHQLRPTHFICRASPGDKHREERLQIPAEYPFIFFKGDAHVSLKI